MRKTYYRSKWAEPAKHYCSEIKGFSSLCPRAFTSEHLLNFIQNGGRSITVGKRNYFTGYGILLHELPVVALLIIQSNNNEGTMKNSILHEIFCKSLFRTS